MLVVHPLEAVDVDDGHAKRRSGLDAPLDLVLPQHSRLRSPVSESLEAISSASSSWV